MVPATPIFYKTIPVFKRFTYSTFTYAIARALAYVVTSLSFIYATEIFSHFGLWLVMIPISLMYIWGLNHFEKLENQKQREVHTPHPLSIKLDELKLAG